MARIKNTTSGPHQAMLAEKYSDEMYSIMEKLKRDKKMLSKEKKEKTSVNS